jgi:hypothetical protein
MEVELPLFYGKFLTPLINDRFIQPAVHAGVEKVLSDKQRVSYGIGSVPKSA